MTDLTLPIHLDPDSPPDDTLHVTASGLPVRVYATDCGGSYPIHGAIFRDGKWQPRSWDANGKYFPGEYEDYFDLRDRAEVKQGVWVAWLKTPSGLDFLRSYANEHEALNDPQEDGALIARHYLKAGDGLDTPADPPLWVDWARLPGWANWAAANKSGDARIFWEQPELGLTIWRSELRSERLPSHLYRLAPGFDWRETLVQRPEDV